MPLPMVQRSHHLRPVAGPSMFINTNTKSLITPYSTLLGRALRLPGVHATAQCFAAHVDGVQHTRYSFKIYIAHVADTSTAMDVAEGCHCTGDDFMWPSLGVLPLLSSRIKLIQLSMHQ